MLENTTTNSLKPETFVSPDLRTEGTERDRVWSRHTGIALWDQDAAWKANVLLVGCGGLGSEVLYSLVKKGYGSIDCLDGDTVDLTNLNRQRFSVADLGKIKAIPLARNVSKDGCMGSRITGYPYFFEGALENGINFSPHIVVCGVDSDQSRRAVAEWAICKQLPAVFCAVSRDSDQCYCLVQRPGEACFGCILPHAVRNEITPCPAVPAIIDPLKLAAALTSFVVDCIVMKRPISWNYRELRLAGFMPDLNRAIKRNPNCPLCSNSGEA